MGTNQLFHGSHATVRRIHQRLGELSAALDAYNTSGKDPIIVLAGRLPTDLPQRQFEAVTTDQIANLVEVTFWASLRSNEGRPVRFSAVLKEAMPPNKRLHTIPFAEALPFDEVQVAKLAPSLPRGQCFVVTALGDALTIEGIANLPNAEWYSIVTRVSEPGIVRVKIGLLDPFAILDGRQNPILEGTARTDLPIYLHCALNNLPRNRQYAVPLNCTTLVSVLEAMAEGGHGGTILVVPDHVGVWERCVNPFPYRFAQPNSLYAETKEQFRRQDSRHSLDDVAATLTNFVAPLAAVDGAVVITKDMRVVGFGAKITCPNQPAFSVSLYEGDSLSSGLHTTIPLEGCGGTRHQSAVRFAHANKDAVALIVSQDHRVSIAHWNEADNSVTLVRGVDFWM